MRVEDRLLKRGSVGVTDWLLRGSHWLVTMVTTGVIGPVGIARWSHRSVAEKSQVATLWVFAWLVGSESQVASNPKVIKNDHLVAKGVLGCLLVATPESLVSCRNGVPGCRQEAVLDYRDTVACRNNRLDACQNSPRNNHYHTIFSPKSGFRENEYLAVNQSIIMSSPQELLILSCFLSVYNQPSI